MNRKPEHYNRLIKAILEEYGLKLEDKPELHKNLFEVPVIKMFGGGERMLMNILKTLLKLGYLEETATPLVFRIVNDSLLDR